MDLIRIHPEVRAALEARRPVVALETTLVSHGFPRGEGVAVAAEAERRVRAAWAVPATIGVVDGVIQVGLTEEQLERFGELARRPQGRPARPGRLRGPGRPRRHDGGRNAGRLPRSGHRLPRHRRARRRAPRLGGAARHLRRPGRARPDGGAGRRLGREVPPRCPGDRRAPRDDRRASARLADRHAAALLHEGGRAARLGPRPHGRGGGSDRPVPLAARASFGSPPRPAAGREPRRRAARSRRAWPRPSGRASAART